MIVYGDFTCPYSYLASRRTDALGAAGVRADWRVVEHEPDLPVTGRRADAAELDAELSAVRRLLLPGEELPCRPPTLVARTQAAVSGYAEAVGAGVADAVRRLLFDAYWREGLDIGSPEVLRTLLAPAMLRGSSTSDPLREFGYAVSVNRGPITTGADQRIRAWRAQWQALDARTIPALCRDGRVEFGVPAVRELGAELGEAGARAGAPAAPTRAAVPAQPSPMWISQVGDPWARTYRSTR